MSGAYSKSQSLGSNHRFVKLFWAHFLSLIGNGLTMSAIGLLAYELAGDEAAAVIGITFAIRIFILVILAPVAGQIAHYLGEKATMVVCQLFRGAVVLGFFFAETIPEIYVLAALMICGSALFVPVYKALIPSVVSSQAYPRALSYGTMAYDVAAVVSPALAALVISIVSFRENFLIHTGTLWISMLLIARLDLGSITLSRNRKRAAARYTLFFGLKEMLWRPRLRRSIWLGLRVSIAGSFISVATVQYVKADLGLSDVAYALTMMAYGLGSTLGALVYGRATESVRRGMLKAAFPTLMIALTSAAVSQAYNVLLMAWFFAGIGHNVYLIASTRLLAENSLAEERTHLYGAQFALSHAGWCLTCPLAGLLTNQWGFHVTAWFFAALFLLVVLALPLRMEQFENARGAV